MACSVLNMLPLKGLNFQYNDTRKVKGGLYILLPITEMDISHYITR